MEKINLETPDVSHYMVHHHPRASSGFCLPFIIYVIVAIVGIIATIASKGSTKQKTINTIVSIVWAGFWAVILYELCKHGHLGWAWALLLFPLIVWFGILILLFFGVITVSEK